MQTVQSLAFDDIKQNFIDYLKSPSNGTALFSDYNFDASGISTIVNLLAYNTHFLGYYVKMMINESFVDSAKLRESMISHAKLVGYTFKGVKSSRAELFVRTPDVFIADLPDNGLILIPRGTKFTATTDSNEQRSFTTIDDYTLYSVYDSLVTTGKKYFANEKTPPTPIVVYEGTQEKWEFLVTADPVQRFIIEDEGVDYTTIRVNVYDTEGSINSLAYSRADTAIGINKHSKVFYLTTNEVGKYEIFFGNNVFGKAVETGNKISVSYMATSGSSGNGAGRNSNWSDAISPTAGVNLFPITIDQSYARPLSTGGVDEETVDSMRFNIPNHYRRQNRLVTTDDYKSILLSEYRNIDSINVWGGESAYRKEFGKVFISIKPKYASKLSDTAKVEISENILKKYGVVGIDPVFVDPEFLYIDTAVDVFIDKSKADIGVGRIEAYTSEWLRLFAQQKLGTFDAMYSEVEAMNYIKSRHASIKSVYSTKSLRKNISVKYSGNPEMEILFGNPINYGVRTSSFKYGTIDVVITDSTNDGKLWLVTKSGGTSILSQSIGTVNYSTGVMRIKTPNGIRMEGEANKGISGTMDISVIPVNPDIQTFMNNIIQLSQISVTSHV